MPTFVVLISKNQFFSPSLAVWRAFKCFFMKKLFFLLLPMMAAIWLTTLGGCRILDGSENDPKPPAGLILEFGTEKPISGARVSLLQYEGEFLGGQSFSEIDAQFSKADGSYDFESTGFLVTATKAGYFTDDQTGKPILGGSERMTDIHLSPHAWFKITLKNQSGAYGFSGPGEDDLSNGRLFLLNKGQDSTIVTFTKGNTDYKYIFSAIPFETPYTDYDFSNLSISGQNGQIAYIKRTNNAGTFLVPLSAHDTTSITITY
jgi:hypothetical protein